MSVFAFKTWTYVLLCQETMCGQVIMKLVQGVKERRDLPLSLGPYCVKNR